ncbi:transferase family-domain-containing protein [Xylariaceae sp. FL0662B]|nr:transferase family-domain-containing protein [Xylariaceae sp. FL0662B]
MPKLQIIELHPKGWENDPADEFFKLAPLDYCVGQVYTNWALFFKLSDSEDRKIIIDTLKRGLEVTLSECRHLCGHLEAHPDGGLCFHKKKESTVEFHVQLLDGPEDEGKYPTFADLEKRHFTGQSLGNLDTWCVAPMTYGEKPEAQPQNNPKVSAFKASFIRGGLVFMMHHHHYSNDINGWAGEMHQLAENCAALWKSPDNPVYPPWDPACLDYSPVSKPEPEQLVEGPPPPEKHPDHKVGEFLLFHLPKSKAAKLKTMASPDDGSFWISTYDALSAYIWRMLSKYRATLFKPDLKGNLIWGEAVNMRTRLHNPPVPLRIQGNVVYVPLSISNPTPQLTTAEVISEAPLSKLAWYNRQLTNSSTQENLDASLAQVAAVRDKTSLFLRMDSFPPMSNIATDWRDSKPYDADFGFGKPYAFRHPFEMVTNGYIIIYPERKNGGPAGADEGNEILIGLEKDASKSLLEDPDWNKYFEFRGVDGMDKGDAAHVN